MKNYGCIKKGRVTLLNRSGILWIKKIVLSQQSHSTPSKTCSEEVKYTNHERNEVLTYGYHDWLGATVDYRMTFLFFCVRVMEYSQDGQFVGDKVITA
jgi:hypothetical protein